MKIFILLSLILLTAISVYAEVERVTLFNEQSFLFDGKNVTLVDSSEDSVIVCVNGQKDIVSEGKTINGMLVELVDGNEGDARLKLDYDCQDDCSCDGDECNNNACLNFINTASSTVGLSISTASEITETSVEENEETTTVTGLENVTGSAINEPSTDTSLKITTYSLFGLAAILGIVAYFRKKGGEDNTLNNLEKEFSEEF